MKAAISVTGLLTITPETPVEAYALRRWSQEAKYSNHMWCNYDAPLMALQLPVSDQPTTAPSARAGGLVKPIAEILAAMYPELSCPHVSAGLVHIVAREVADWLDRIGNKGSANDLRREIDR